ncbi:MAG: hypothetical protein U0R51_09975 [Solirubrobacterales bacterium]
MTRARIGVAAGLGMSLAGAALLAAGCQSTQATSAQREAEGQKLIKSEKGLVVKQKNKDIEVVDTTLLSDKNGTAVVVEVKNTSDQGYAHVPIAIDVSDAKGKTVFKNNVPGLAPALTEIPAIGPGETFDWVHDQILATGEPDEVEATIGAGGEELPASPPEIELTNPTLKQDQFSGVEATGEAENKSQVEQRDVTVFAVARDGNRIVAAGRGGLRRLEADPDHGTPYHVFFIGDPEGADIEVTAPPVQLQP